MSDKTCGLENEDEFKSLTQKLHDCRNRLQQAEAEKMKLREVNRVLKKENSLNEYKLQKTHERLEILEKELQGGPS